MIKPFHIQKQHFSSISYLPIVNTQPIENLLDPIVRRLKELKLKTVAFIAGKKNPAVQKFYIRFSIENFITNISLYALSWPQLNFGCYLTFEIIF